jgi:hypothetical protein
MKKEKFKINNCIEFDDIDFSNDEKKSIENMMDNIKTKDDLSFDVNKLKPYKQKNWTMEEKIRRAKSLIERHGKDGVFFLGGD